MTAERLEARAEVVVQLVCEPMSHRPGLEQPREQRWVTAKGVGEELAGPAEAGQQRYSAWMSAQEAQKGGAVTLPRKAFQVVERHVGVGRRRQLREQTGEHRRQ